MGNKVKIWDFITLSEVCNFEKGKTALMKAKAGEYPLVATGKDRKTCDTYQFDTKAVCVPLVSSTGHGHASLKYVHYQEGKFALGTILVAIIPKDENILNAQFLHIYLSRLKDKILVPLMTGAANVTLSITKLKTVKIPLPPIEEQLKIVSLFNRIDSKQIKLINEIDTQQQLLKKLRQSILQEAIEGKLTKQWREQNPDIESASVLLEKIKQEKERLIKEKKIKKQKPLPPISEGEVPFNIPDSWVWCRLNTLVSILGDGLHGTPHYKENEKCYFINGNNLSNGKIIFKDSTKTVSDIEYEKYKKPLTNRTILVSINGTLGNVAFYNNEYIILGKSACYFNLLNMIDKKYIKFIIESQYFLEYAVRMSSKTTINNLSLKNMNLLPIPLPPLAEQKEIVKKIENLFTLCDKLEIEIQSSKKSSEELMQAVLKEAFEQ